MARVSLIQEKDHPEIADLTAKIRSGRRGALLNIYKLLLHSPPLAATWFEHFNAVRWKTELAGRTREIVIIRVALLNRMDYVLRQHVPSLAQAEGLSEQECSALSDWETSSLFNASERAALGLADAMTRAVDVPDSVFTDLRRDFSERQIVELAVLIGSYNMHNRVFSALKVDPEGKTA